MNAIVVIVATILALAFDASFAEAFTLRSTGSITPQVMPCLIVFVALFAPETTALLVALLLGALVDLSPGHGQLGAGAHIIGPSALGFFVTTYLILKVRTSLKKLAFRHLKLHLLI